MADAKWMRLAVQYRYSTVNRSAQVEVEVSDARETEMEAAKVSSHEIVTGGRFETPQKSQEITLYSPSLTAILSHIRFRQFSQLRCR
jgi:hypothetical protein